MVTCDSIAIKGGRCLVVRVKLRTVQVRIAAEEEHSRFWLLERPREVRYDQCAGVVPFTRVVSAHH